MATGPSPLDIMLQVMHRRWAENKEKEAVDLARMAAPFVHPRAVAGRGGAASPDQMSDDELAETDDPTADDPTADDPTADDPTGDGP